MPQSHVTAFFLFDIGDSIDLSRVRGQIEARAAARLPTRPAAPTYIQYQQPPLIVDGHTLGLSDINGFQVRFKLFEYGVLSVALTRHRDLEQRFNLRHACGCTRNTRSFC